MAMALEEAMPPAPPREVGEWVRVVARDALATRATLIAGIEAYDLATPEMETSNPPPAALPASEAPTVITSALPAPTPAALPASEAPTVITSAAIPRPVAPPGAAQSSATPPSRPRLLLASVASALVVLLGAGTLAVLSLRSRDETSAPVTAPAPATATAPATAPVTAPATAPVIAPATESATESATATATESATATATAPSRGRRDAGAPSVARPPASKSCDPPFFIAKDGTKKYKLECL
jgi:hypothetical protein